MNEDCYFVNGVRRILINKAAKMKILKININNLEKSVLDECLNVLSAGGIIVHPTDTCYGIAADIHNKKAVKKVYDFKQRSGHKPLSIIVSGKEMFLEYGTWIDEIEKFMANKDRMHTFLVKKKSAVPEYFNGGIEDVAIQVPKNNFSLKLLEYFGSPLTATSANISGKDHVYSIEDLVVQMEGKSVLPDLVIDAGILPKNKPSKIIKIKTGGTYDVLRS